MIMSDRHNVHIGTSSTLLPRCKPEEKNVEKKTHLHIVSVHNVYSGNKAIDPGMALEKKRSASVVEDEKNIGI